MTEDDRPTQATRRPRRASGMFASKAAVALQFSVLLALAVLAFVLVRGLERNLADRDALVEELTATIDDLGEDATGLVAAIDRAMSKRRPPGQDRVQFLSELVQARDEAAALQQDRDRLAGATRTLESIGRKLQEADIGDTVEHALDRLIGIAAELAEYEEADGPRSGLRDRIAELGSLLDRRDQEIRKTEGLTESLRRAREWATRVTQKPACWVDAQTEKQEYIFDVALLKGGFVVRDNRLPHRAVAQAMLPIEDLKFDTFVDWDTFLLQTSGIFAWSIAEDCRFFVRAFDATGAHDKEAYKAGMRILEQRFFKLEIRDETFPLEGIIPKDR